MISENSKTNVAYAGNVNLNTNNCLYICLPSELRNVITAKKIKYVTGDTANYTIHSDIADKIWLRSPGLDWDGSARNISTSGDINGWIPAIDIGISYCFCIR